MDITEKPSDRKTAETGKSLIERAADRLGSVGWQEGAATPPSAPRRSAGSASPVVSVPASPSPPVSEAPSGRASDAPPTLPSTNTPGAAEGKTERPATRNQININFTRLQEMGFVVPGVDSKIAEEMRLIKRPLLRKAFAERGRGRSHVIMVTSARPAEGKTFTAINLALSMASEQNKTVLLIDADLAQPQIPRILDFKAERGLVELLVDDNVDMSDVLIRTNVESLTLLPAGRQIPHANELFASARMVEFIDDVAERYNDRVIIFDLPPLLARSEPSVLAAHMGQIVFVVEAEKTNETALREALKMLAGHKNVGLVLNKVQSLYGSEGFGQYYGGYYR